MAPYLLLSRNPALNITQIDLNFPQIKKQSGDLNKPQNNVQMYMYSKEQVGESRGILKKNTGKGGKKNPQPFCGLVTQRLLWFYSSYISYKHWRTRVKDIAPHTACGESTEAGHGSKSFPWSFPWHTYAQRRLQYHKALRGLDFCLWITRLAMGLFSSFLVPLLLVFFRNWSILPLPWQKL